MAVVIGAEVVDALLLGVGGRRRELQDFPVLGDVWARFAEEPGKEQDLLFTPTWEKPAGEVAKLVANTDSDPASSQKPYSRNVAYLQALAVGSLSLDDLIAVALPATKWWEQINDKWSQDRYDDLVEGKAEEGRPTGKRIRPWIDWELEQALHDEAAGGKLTAGPSPEKRVDMETEDRQTAKLGLLIGILQAAAAKDGKSASRPDTIKDAVSLLGRKTILNAGVRAIRLMIQRRRQFSMTVSETGHRWNGLIFQVSLNRDASPAIAQSVGAIKGDAARSLFSISCKEIGWAVVDSGIDQTHPAFWDYEKIWKAQDKAAKDLADKKEPAPAANPPPHRIKATFDFRRIRAIMSVEAVDHDKLVGEIEPQSKLTAPQIKESLEALAADRKAGKRVNWAKVQPLIEQKLPELPPHPHGTHVAGIIGAHWVKAEPRQPPRRTDPVKMSGVCPDIGLYDFRVLGADLGDSEFAVIAALQFIRFLNDQSGYSLIHGANLSLSIPHNVRNYACGRTQVCIEAESLTANGVVIVAAAGNRGFQQYRMADNSMFESYAASSITDPGNAEGVITVGATHRHWPHTYGVSFFSSRGPTGDGRLKPDLLAPGEKIESCIPGGRSDQMDGTSMAAPHVSGAAALLMARHQELQGQPARIKEILCATATDLKRERSFQGHGMVDVLRAIQSI